MAANNANKTLVTEPLISHIRKFCTIDLERLSILESFFEHRTYRKKEILLNEGNRCYEKFFIVKGCVHLYYLKQNGIEQTTDFALEHWWISDFMAFQNSSIAQFSIRAVEKTEVLCISADNQRELLNQFPELNAYFHLVFQRACAASQVRFRLMFELSKEDLYRHFNQLFPEFIQRIPQYLLASFLGFTPEYLSEIRKKNIS
ncbi:cyclic nucleotide-binding protein [Niastella yeongjuensis]|uniref:Cyclic nucleotide-binding protein n=1 Tax=Niastella yeongjuensis TaxID=354355 RepID=A0A1V9DXP1_9BACT|nr:Crp/Fnr family transcriptional regulator [Niastella yeongjuensis]OQP38622.1 cyclic nucleotide-binding protein [Niastella yeongjuensis]SEO39159.1 cAMP-binding domain of CRP or a regulatory subunit of cAMP-dependent protein kinases [Niastella yeongjuensis]